MILVDSSVWIEFFRAREPVFSQLLRLLEDREALAMECVFAELLQGAKGRRERLTIHEMWESLPHFRQANVLLKAGEVSGTHKWKDRGIGLIDAWIITAARTAKARIWSLDKKLMSVLEEGEIYNPLKS